MRNVNVITNAIKKALEVEPDGRTYQDHLLDSNNRKHKIIEAFQRCLAEKLSNCCNNVCQGCVNEAGTKNGCEYELYSKLKEEGWDNIKDRADIRQEISLNNTEYELIIEIDATRADQVAKKMMSRFCYAVLKKKPIVYVALLYKGTSSMNSDECKKFFKMGYELIKKISESNIMIGYIIGDDNSPYIFQKGKESQECDDIKDDEAFDSDLYRRYLEDNGVQSPASIECYMLPHNKFYSSQNSGGPDDLKKKLIAAEENFENFINDFGGKKAYWRKYQHYLKEEWNKAKENDENSI